MTGTHRPAKAHSDLFTTVPAPGQQASLIDYSPQLAEPTHDLDSDLTVEPMDDRPKANILNKAREGSIVTLNTAVQATVTAIDETTPEDIWYINTSTIHTPTILTLEPFNCPDNETLHLVKDGATYKDTFALFYQQEDGTRTDIEHLAVDNEDNLKDEIDIARYETFKQHVGGKALFVEENAITVCRLNAAEDGDLWHDVSSSREKKQTIDGADSKAWYLPATSRNMARSPTIFQPSTDGTAESNTDGGESEDSPPLYFDTADESALTDAQLDALNALCELPCGSYTATQNGLKMSTTLNGTPAALRLAEPSTCQTALPGIDFPEDQSADIRAPERESPGTPSDCVTNIIGVGDATAADLSGAAYNPSTSKSKSKVRENFEASETDDVRELSEEEIEARFGDVRDDYEPPETVDRDGFITIREFVNDAIPLFELSGAYFTRAVAELRAFFAGEYDPTPGQIVELHAGATNSKLYDQQGDKLGLLPELMFGQFDAGDVHTAIAWDGYSGDSPLPEPEDDTKYAVSRNSPESIDLGYPDRSEFARDTVTQMTRSDVTDDYVTFHNGNDFDDIGAAFANGDIAAGVLNVEVVEYVNALFGIDLTDDDTVSELVTVTADNSIFISHPSIDVTFSAFKYKPVDSDDENTDET